MSTQTTLQLRIDTPLKQKAAAVLKEIGLDLSSGIKLFLNEVAMSETIPFTPSTSKAKKLRNYPALLKEIEYAKKHGKRYTSAKKLLDDLMRN